MCGLAVLLGLDGRKPDQAVVEQMTQALVHRGPDDCGFYYDGSVGFGFRRLSILDLSADGHQPMLTPDDQLAIVFNGEIFNYIELREELAAKGHTFRSTGDTEVLLHAYREWGAECLRRLNGMWAFVIHDKRQNLLFGARDRFGIKPLYVHRSPHAVLIASEIKALHASGLTAVDINWRSAARFLIQGLLDDTPETLYAEIEQVEPGTAFTLAPSGDYRQWRYWDLPATTSDPANEAPERFADLLEDSVRLRMRSDVPVGVCLSGGLDSTSIVCAMARQRGSRHGLNPGPLLAFSYNAPEFDESRFVRDTIEQTGAKLVPLAAEGRQMWDNLERMLRFQDEPVHSTTPFVGFALMGLAARSNVTVVLNGQGADETLAGYPAYFRDYWYTLLSGGHPVEALREISAFAASRGSGFGGHTTDLLRHYALSQMNRFPLYHGMAERIRRHNARRDPWFRESLTERLPPRNAGAIDLTLNGALKRSVEGYPLPLYLRIEDRNSMAHSTEVRLPFMDYRLVSYLFQLPAERKMRGPYNKHVLREAMRGRIPESVRSRLEKMGFPTPMRRWVSTAVCDPLRDMLSSRAARERGIYRMDRLLSDVDRTQRGEVDVAGRLFRVAQFELWTTLEGAR